MKIELILGDITKLDISAIVNAANTRLLGGGGVDGAIHNAAGKQLLEECKTLGGCLVGEAKITKGYNLKAKYVIHTVGPIYSKNENRDNLLYNAYYNSLLLVESYNIESIAFPNISTGVYGYPKDLASDIALKAINDFSKKSTSVKLIVFCCFDEENYMIYQQKLGQK